MEFELRNVGAEVDIEDLEDMLKDASSPSEYAFVALLGAQFINTRTPNFSISPLDAAKIHLKAVAHMAVRAQAVYGKEFEDMMTQAKDSLQDQLEQGRGSNERTH